MDWSTSALMNNSPLARRLPGQRTPPDPTIGQANAADLTYGWHMATNSSSDEGNGSAASEAEAEGHDGNMTRQQEAALALRQRRRERRAARRRPSLSDADTSSDEGSIASYNSATAEQENVEGATGTKEKETVPPVSTPNPDVDTDGFICRICFDGPSSQDEGGETLGRLIAPCRCRGTMKFVHQACLTRWRAASMRQSSIVACDQCGSPYKFRKSKFVGLATNRLLILFVSCLLFLGLIWTVGFTAETVVRRWDDTAEMSSLAKDGQGRSRGETGNPIWQKLFGEDEEGEGQGYDEYQDDVYTYGYGYVTSLYWEPFSYFKLAMAAVKHVGSGRATRAVKELVQGETKNSPEDSHTKKELGWFSTLVDDWKYGSGGLWEGQRPEDEEISPQSSSDDEVSMQSDADSEGPKKTTSERERYDARTATVLEPGEEPKRYKGSTSSSDKQVVDLKSGWWDRITLQFSLGFSLVGIFSFIKLLLGVSFMGPFHLGNFGLGRGFARLTGGRRRGGGGGGDGGTISSVILLFLVVIGILRALMAVISFTNYLSKRLLTRVEDYIVEYSGEEEQGQRGIR